MGFLFAGYRRESITMLGEYQIEKFGADVRMNIFGFQVTMLGECGSPDHPDFPIGRRAIICASSVSLPGVLVGDGAAVGALRLVKVSYDAFGIYAEAPARKVGGRKCDVLALEHVFLATRRGQS